MRGKARKTRAAAAYLRITPAYAGKSRTNANCDGFD